MQNHYLEAAEKIADLADRYSEDNQLSTILRYGAIRIMEKSGKIFINPDMLEEIKKAAVNE